MGYIVHARHVVLWTTPTGCRSLRVSEVECACAIYVEVYASGRVYVGRTDDEEEFPL